MKEYKIKFWRYWNTVTGDIAEVWISVKKEPEEKDLQQLRSTLNKLGLNNLNVEVEVTYKY